MSGVSLDLGVLVLNQSVTGPSYQRVSYRNMLEKGDSKRAVVTKSGTGKAKPKAKVVNLYVLATVSVYCTRSDHFSRAWTVKVIFSMVKRLIPPKVTFNSKM